MISVAANCDAFVLDDVLWVQTAQRDHFEFMALSGLTHQDGTQVHAI